MNFCAKPLAQRNEFPIANLRCDNVLANLLLICLIGQAQALLGGTQHDEMTPKRGQRVSMRSSDDSIVGKDKGAEHGLEQLRLYT